MLTLCIDIFKLHKRDLITAVVAEVFRCSSDEGVNLGRVKKDAEKLLNIKNIEVEEDSFDDGSYMLKFHPKDMGDEFCHSCFGIMVSFDSNSFDESFDVTISTD